MSIRVGLGQINMVMGDFAGNLDKMRSFYEQALQESVDLLVFPEMAICGYPPEDLLLKPHFLEENRKAVEDLAGSIGNMTVLAGFAESYQGRRYNSVAALRNGKIEQIYRKSQLPNYGVFDEKRYFDKGNQPVVIDIKGLKVVLTICEDIWNLGWLADFLKNDSNFGLIINISGSPFHKGKVKQRQNILADCAKRFNCPVGHCNLVGGQDELVFDGQSMFIDSTGKAIFAPAFEQALLIADIDRTRIKPIKGFVKDIPTVIDEIYRALVLGSADYVVKNGFERVVIGLSGGIDSSLVAAIAVDALGAENVVGITMPSRFNKAETINDAELLAKNLGIEFHTIPIEPVVKSFDGVLREVPGWDNVGLAFENLQSRIRGNILMSLSNQHGFMVLTTGNKSETAVGYSTLYGDTAGGFAVIKDVPKTMVYELCNYINRIKGSEVIPTSVINRPPSAELRAEQLDSDSLPDYDLLDRILAGYVEQDKSAQQLVDDGLPADVVNRVIAMVNRNEYKRRQSPPGVKITPKAFGRDRRLPITNKYS